MILLGAQDDDEKLAQGILHCPNEGHNTVHVLLRRRKYITLFFVRAVEYKDELFLRCNVCGEGTKVPPEREAQVRAMLAKRVVRDEE